MPPELSNQSEVPVQRHGAFIDGERHESSDGDMTIVVDPSTNQPIAEVTRSGATDPPERWP